MNKTAAVAVIGEAMVELGEVDAAPKHYRLNYAGDAFNTAVWLSRLGVQTAFVSLIGHDRFSDGIAERARAERLLDQGLLRAERGQPGLYLIENDADGQRRFYYWRSSSIARELFTDSARVKFLAQYLQSFEQLYFTGITAAVMGLGAWEPFLETLEHVRNSGTEIVFDPNWRPALWPGLELARQRLSSLIKLCNVVLPTYDDEVALWSRRSEQEVIDAYTTWGVGEIVLKCDAAKAIALCNGSQAQMTSSYQGDVVDTSGAGDAFNAGYLAARLRGLGLEERLIQAHETASRVLALRGALP